MDKFCLGIIGRCLALQPWIQISDLYHRQLKNMLEKDGIILRVSLAGRSDLEPSERMRALHTKKSLDGVLYHMRHVDMHPKPLLYRTVDPLGKFRYSLPPNFFKRILSKKKTVYIESNAVQAALSMRKNKDSQDLFDIPPEQLVIKTLPRKFLGVPLHQVNLWAGKLCGLNTWALADEWTFFERLRTLCLELNIPLFVLGPIPSVDMLETENFFLFQQIRKIIETKLSSQDIPYYFFYSLHDEMGKAIHKKDRSHLTPEGHSFLARELYPIISPWFKSILSAKQLKKSN
ncbi:MAG: hypothetical protein HZB76_01675 [Chlamydiae bacterium]|nr:hypothetical protein [Chlamydiota bacterium]